MVYNKYYHLITFLVHINVHAKLHYISRLELYWSTLLTGRAQSVLIHKRPITTLRILYEEL